MRPRSVALSFVFAVFANACDCSSYREVSIDLDQANQAAAGKAPGWPKVLRVSVASMESPRDTYSDYAHLFGELARRLDVELSFVQRRTYGDVNGLLAEGRLDVALICSGGYVAIERSSPGAVEVVAVPVVNGLSTYNSLILVPAGSPAASLSDLAGKRFALADELSLTGRGYLEHLLKSTGRDPSRFFGPMMSTGAHDRSIIAVARGMVDGAAVHSIVYEHQLARDPTLSSRSRVIHRSPPFGMPPLVASTRLSAAFRARLREVLLTFGDDPAGAQCLSAVHIERFVEAPFGLFDSARQALEAR
ncbi:MAG: PhnD/SsuA/transferrin family substrate-binding protein [Myxococcaceae bacterium]